MQKIKNTSENTVAPGDLTDLRSDWIHNHLLELSARERKLSAEIIEYLAEVDRRKIFAELGYPSLFSYVTDGLGYSEGAATRRINAARLFRQIPEVREKINEGALTLGQLSNVTCVIRKSETENNKKISIAEKKVILEKLEFKSQRESEKELAETFNLQVVEFTKVVVRKNETYEVKFALSKQDFDLIEKTKNSLSHTVPTHDVKDLLLYFCNNFQKDQIKKREKLKEFSQVELNNQTLQNQTKRKTEKSKNHNYSEEKSNRVTSDLENTESGKRVIERPETSIQIKTTVNSTELLKAKQTKVICENQTESESKNRSNFHNNIFQNSNSDIGAGRAIASNCPIILMS